jgi:hypothetical protein
MRFADARFAASIMMSCSMIRSLIGGQWLWNTNRSAPRTLSPKRQ